MSLPRRAMQEMGLQVCCLICDAKDEPKLKRCKKCISSHRSLMGEIEKISAESPIKHLAMELITMSRNPHKFPHNKEHTDSLEIYQTLILNHQRGDKEKSVEDIESVFLTQRENKKYSKGNINENIKNIVKTIPRGIPQKLGRTHPKKEVNKIKLNEKLGEEIKDKIRKKERGEKYKILEEIDGFLNDD